MTIAAKSGERASGPELKAGSALKGAASRFRTVVSVNEVLASCARRLESDAPHEQRHGHDRPGREQDDQQRSQPV